MWHHPTAGRPYVCRPIPAFVRSLAQLESARAADGEQELSWFDPDTGLIVYSTVLRTLSGNPNRAAAVIRAANWARRHGFKYDPSTGRHTRVAP